MLKQNQLLQMCLHGQLSQERADSLVNKTRSCHFCEKCKELS